MDECRGDSRPLQYNGDKRKPCREAGVESRRVERLRGDETRPFGLRIAGGVLLAGTHYRVVLQMEHLLYQSFP